jgi:hypothetical protein
MNTCLDKRTQNFSVFLYAVLWQEMQNKANILHLQLKNRDFSKNKAKSNPFLGFLCRFTKRSQMESRNHENAKQSQS